MAYIVFRRAWTLWLICWSTVLAVTSCSNVNLCKKRDSSRGQSVLATSQRLSPLFLTEEDPHSEIRFRDANPYVAIFLVADTFEYPLILGHGHRAFPNISGDWSEDDSSQAIFEIARSANLGVYRPELRPTRLVNHSRYDWLPSPFFVFPMDIGGRHSVFERVKPTFGGLGLSVFGLSLQSAMSHLEHLGGRVKPIRSERVQGVTTIRWQLMSRETVIAGLAFVSGAQLSEEEDHWQLEDSKLPDIEAPALTRIDSTCVLEKASFAERDANTQSTKSKFHSVELNGILISKDEKVVLLSSGSRWCVRREGGGFRLSDSEHQVWRVVFVSPSEAVIVNDSKSRKIRLRL